MDEPAMTAQQARVSSSSASALSRYRELVVGANASSREFLQYELVTSVCSNLPGLLGLGARASLYPGLLKSCGSRPAIGRGVLIRNPRRISFGKNVIIDDYAVIDVRGEDGSIEIGDHVCIGRFSSIIAKNGRISLGAGVNVSSSCRIATESSVSIGKSVLIAAYAYIGPGNHQEGDSTQPLISQKMEIKGGVTIGSHAWIGTRATIMDGVQIGARSVVAAHAFVRDSVPEGATVGGLPARILSQGA